LRNNPLALKRLPVAGLELELTRWTLVSHADGLFSAAVLDSSALAGEALSRGLQHLRVQRGLDLLRRWPEL
jgi:hypothetical protein